MPRQNSSVTSRLDDGSNDNPDQRPDQDPSSISQPNGNGADRARRDGGRTSCSSRHSPSHRQHHQTGEHHRRGESKTKTRRNRRSDDDADRRRDLPHHPEAHTCGQVVPPHGTRVAVVVQRHQRELLVHQNHWGEQAHPERLNGEHRRQRCGVHDVPCIDDRNGQHDRPP